MPVLFIHISPSNIHGKPEISNGSLNVITIFPAICRFHINIWHVVFFLWSSVEMECWSVQKCTVAVELFIRTESITIIVFSPDSHETRSRGSTGSGGESSSMLTSMKGNAVQVFCTRKNASN
jgi:hypothetical protein